MSERELLEQFALRGSGEAFERLVRGNIDMVYSAARRQVGDAELAEDVTQAVFVLLARKAGKIRGPLAGWLILTTHFCAANANKLAARREFHERRAGEMKLAESGVREQAEWDSYTPMLDGAMARLRQKDRDAVAMRFLQNVSFRDVGVALGISEEAARKRVDRAVQRLRKILSGKGMAVGALAEQLAQRGTEGAPVEMVGRVVASGGAAAKGTMAGAIAYEVGLMVFLAKVKIATMVLVVLLAAVAGAGIAINQSRSKLAAPVQTPAPVAPGPTNVISVNLEGEEPESQIVGTVQLIRWDLILNEAGAAAVSSVGGNIALASKVYQAMRFDGAELRHAVANAMAAGDVIRASQRVELIDLNSPHDSNWRSEQLAFQYDSGNQQPFLWAIGDSMRFNDEFDRLGANRVHVKLDHPDLNFGIADRQYQNLSRTPGGNGIVYDGELSGGDAVAFLAKITSRSGKAYYHLATWETFRALPSQMSAVGIPHDAGWWCQHGPATLRHWADVERLWAADASWGRTWGPPAIERKLDDGESVWLWALCRPQKWPFCWWDPTGKPASPWSDAIWMGNDLSAGLWVQVGVTVPFDLQRKLSAANGGAADFDLYNTARACAQIADDATQVVVGVPIGPWKETRLKFGESAKVDDLNFQMDAKPTPGNTINLMITGVVNDQIQVNVICKDGTKANGAGDFGRQLKWGKDSVPGTVTMTIPVGESVEKIDYCDIRRRSRRFVTFTGFATKPAAAPKSDLSAEEARLELAKLRQQDVQHYLDALASARGGYVFAFFGNDLTNWNGAKQQLLHAAVMGDQQTVRELLMTHDPSVEKLLDSIAHLFVLGEAIRIESIKRFGEPATHQVLDRPGLFEDWEAELASCGWSGTIDRYSPPTGPIAMATWDDRMEPMVWRAGKDGKFQLDVDGLAQRPDLATELAMKIKVGDEINARLHKGMTIGELKVSVAPLLPVAVSPSR